MSSESNIAAILQESKGKVLPILILRLATRLIGRQDASLNIWAAILLGFWPLVILIGQILIGGSASTIEMVLTPSYCLLVMLAFFWSARSWDELIAIGSEVDRVFRSHTKVLERFVPFLSAKRQVVALTVGGIFSFVASVFLVRAIGAEGNVGSSYYFSVTWTGLVGAITIYWIWAAPFILHFATRLTHPNVFVLDPLRTPGLEGARSVLSRSTRRCIFGLILFSIPVGLTVLQYPDELVVLAFGGIALGVSLVTVAFIALAPQVFISKVARTGQINELKRIQAEFSSHRSTKEDKHSLVTLYAVVSSARVSLLDGRRIARLAFDFVFAAAPVGIPLLDALIK